LRPLPPWRPSLVVAIGAVCVLGDLALRVPTASLAAALTVVATVGLLAIAGRLDSLAQRCGAVLALAAGSLLAVRASVWVVSMLVVATLGLVMLIAADGLVLGQRRPWARATRNGFEGAYDVFGWLRRGGGQLSGRAAGRTMTWLRAATAATGVTLVLGMLLASGDAAFGWLVSGLDLVSWTGHLLTFLVLAVPVSVLALLAARANPEPLSGAECARAFRAEALTALWATALTLLAWCGLQVAVIGGGATSVLADQGITAAEYAREGFFQLVAVAAVSLAVVNVAHRTGRSGRGPDRAQRLPAVVIGLALAVLIVVSFSRLWYYVGEFGMTMLRLSVATFLGWLALMTALSVARAVGLHHERNWLPSAAVLSAALFAVVFGAANPERWVAQINLERATIEEPVDVRYLTRSLSSDAKGVVADYAWSRLGGRPDAVIDWLCTVEPEAGYGPFGWNRSRAASYDVDCET